MGVRQLTSQPHPEPCTATVAALNLSLKFSNEPKSSLIASIKAPKLQDFKFNSAIFPEEIGEGSKSA